VAGSCDAVMVQMSTLWKTSLDQLQEQSNGTELPKHRFHLVRKHKSALVAMFSQPEPTVTAKEVPESEQVLTVESLLESVCPISTWDGEWLESIIETEQMQVMFKLLLFFSIFPFNTILYSIFFFFFNRWIFIVNTFLLFCICLHNTLLVTTVTLGVSCFAMCRLMMF
jgi:hypothetical protein